MTDKAGLCGAGFIAKRRDIWNPEKKMNSATDNSGFTLVELILVIVIFAILVAVAVPKFINLMDTTVESNRCASAKGAINSALSVTYAAILLDDPTRGNWLEVVTIAELDDSMFVTGVVPVCPKHGTFSISHGQVICSIHN